MTPRITLKIVFDSKIWSSQSKANLDLKFTLACGAGCSASSVEMSCRTVTHYRLNYSPHALVQTMQTIN
jgi:hypothetical protein